MAECYNVTADKLKAGYSLFGIEGTLEEASGDIVCYTDYKGIIHNVMVNQTGEQPVDGHDDIVSTLTSFTSKDHQSTVTFNIWNKGNTEVTAGTYLVDIVAYDKNDNEIVSFGGVIRYSWSRRKS
ncbi:MAG: hypothetical protein K2P14_10290 [Anaeroplasmataceae bacterium]|nr:hypothetical protein [Anaeroplasmataceae bacterium]